MENKFFVGTSSDIYLGFQIEQMEKIVENQNIIQVPGIEKYYSGIIYWVDENKNKNILPILNTRRYLEIESKEEELEKRLSFLDEKVKDHIEWKNSLENQILNNKDLTIELNPHNCKFGKWFYQYINSNSTPTPIKNILSKIEDPHKKFHQFGEKIKEKYQKDPKKAIIYYKTNIEKEIKNIENSFKNLKKELKYHILHNNTILIGRNKNNQRIGIEIDKVDNIYTINKFLSSSRTYKSKKAISKIGKPKENQDILVNIIDINKL